MTQPLRYHPPSTYAQSSFCSYFCSCFQTGNSHHLDDPSTISSAMSQPHRNQQGPPKNPPASRSRPLYPVPNTSQDSHNRPQQSLQGPPGPPPVSRGRPLYPASNPYLLQGPYQRPHQSTTTPSRQNPPRPADPPPASHTRPLYPSPNTLQDPLKKPPGSTTTPPQLNLHGPPDPPPFSPARPLYPPPNTLQDPGKGVQQSTMTHSPQNLYRPPSAPPLFRPYNHSQDPHRRFQQSQQTPLASAPQSSMPTPTIPVQEHHTIHPGTVSKHELDKQYLRTDTGIAPQEPGMPTASRSTIPAPQSMQGASITVQIATKQSSTRPDDHKAQIPLPRLGAPQANMKEQPPVKNQKPEKNDYCPQQ